MTHLLKNLIDLSLQTKQLNTTMAKLRFDALNQANNRPTVKVELPGKISEYFGQDVFDLKKMQALLSPDIFKKVRQAIDEGPEDRYGNG